MRTNGLERPVGVSPKEAPVLSWIVKSQGNNTLQTAYEVIVTTNGRKVWSSGKVASDNSTMVEAMLHINSCFRILAQAGSIQ